MSPRWPSLKDKPKLTKAAMALSGIEAAMSRREIAYALQLNDDPLIRQVGEMLTDHEWRNATLAVICKNMNLGWAKIGAAIKEVKKGEGEIRMAMHLPQIMEDTAVDALSVDEICVRCEGTGKIESSTTSTSESGEKIITNTEKICPPCVGRGSVRRHGDTNARKLVFEAASLSGKSAPLIDNSQHVHLGDGLEDTLKALRKVRDGNVKTEVVRPILDGVVGDGNASDR